jgi:hypothetical protein
MSSEVTEFRRFTDRMWALKSGGKQGAKFRYSARLAGFPGERLGLIQSVVEKNSSFFCAPAQRVALRLLSVQHDDQSGEQKTTEPLRETDVESA